MTFRKNQILFLENTIINFCLAVLSLTIVPITGIFVSVIFAGLFIALLVVTSYLQNEFITIDETGISCNRAGKLLWSHDWESIAELKRITWLRMPAIEIILDPSEMSDCPQTSGHFFQLCRSARLAIKKYYSSIK